MGASDQSHRVGGGKGDAQDEVCVARQASEPVRGENHGLVAP